MSTKSSLKRARQIRERNVRNKRVKKSFKTAIKKLELGIKEKKGIQELTPLLTKAISLIDKAAKKGVLHKNTAGRKKSLISKKIKKHLAK
ncbi:MAG: 30S ribosomal protein S20 [Candidatus Omnitrophica bacterium]|nr:30S ribosomal protein S20 [Candidatus Omnitrophota bacterium]MBU1047935.1 30S ribosomal protein S20 [Candidatus Omnitrophota bacterium]MBU1630332.1 30S ribosomal protein S20 [Candidatus Omnitrophota bacterium]MBU1767172.1 30S ribosomal protein S20 [Candidatus Omnitrophota bacterium]MBU1889782.1 30S ribosomal protein S20 [Candidatus Omnitrophota bacterium]